MIGARLQGYQANRDFLLSDTGIYSLQYLFSCLGNTSNSHIQSDLCSCQADSTPCALPSARVIFPIVLCVCLFASWGWNDKCGPPMSAFALNGDGKKREKPLSSFNMCVCKIISYCLRMHACQRDEPNSERLTT